MKHSRFIIILILALVLAACGGGNATDTATQPPDNNVEQPAYPGPQYVAQPTGTPWYPAPGTPGAPLAGMPMSTGYEPQVSDADFTRGEIFLELESSELLVMESTPVQVTAILVGNLPDPCHQLRVAIYWADANNQINIDAYSLMNPDTTCTTVLSPFTARIPLGTYSGGHFSVYVNYQLLGEFDS